VGEGQEAIQALSFTNGNYVVANTHRLRRRRCFQGSGCTDSALQRGSACESSIGEYKSSRTLWVWAQSAIFSPWGNCLPHLERSSSVSTEVNSALFLIPNCFLSMVVGL